VLTIELEDGPGCARRDRDATPALDQELRLPVAYLRALADEGGIPPEGLGA
jgi:hypothetical protein